MSALKMGRTKDVETVPVRVTLSSRATGARDGAVLYAGEARVKLSPVIKNARARLGPAYENTRVRATPLLDSARMRATPVYDTARERITPAVGVARDRLSADVGPRASAGLAAAAAAGEQYRDQAKERGAAAVGALREAVTPPARRKPRAWTRVAVLGALAGLVAAGLAWWRTSRGGSQAWVTDDVEQPAPSSPAPAAAGGMGVEESAELTVVSVDAGGAAPDEARADENRSGPSADLDEGVEPARATPSDVDAVIADAEVERHNP